MWQVEEEDSGGAELNSRRWAMRQKLEQIERRERMPLVKQGNVVYLQCPESRWVASERVWLILAA